jgi:hypothetical protein
LLLGAALGATACSNKHEEAEKARLAAVASAAAAASAAQKREAEQKAKIEALQADLGPGTITEADREKLKAELERAKLGARAVYGGPPRPADSASKKPCKCPKGDPLCSCF